MVLRHIQINSTRSSERKSNCLTYLSANKIRSYGPILFAWRKGQDVDPSPSFKMVNQEQALAYPFWRKGQDSNLRRFPSLVFKTSAINHSATFPPFIIPQILPLNSNQNLTAQYSVLKIRRYDHYDDQDIKNC